MNRRFEILLSVFLVSVFFTALAADELPPELEQKYQEKKAFKQQAYDNTINYIRENPESPNLARLYFNLAELSIEIDVDQPQKTLEYFHTVLEHDAEFDREDVIYYNIGYYSFMVAVNERNDKRLDNLDLATNWPDEMRLSEEKLQPAISAYSTIMNDHPQSIYHTESIYRLGTIYFEIAMDARQPQPYFRKAIEYFDLVAQKQDDPLYQFGLFQRGWSYFSSGSFENAIEDFTLILELIHNQDSDMKRALFEADAIDNIAFSLIEYDGTDYDRESVAAEKAKEIFINYISDDYAQDIIRKAIELELRYSAPMRAVDIYNSFIWLYPLHQECPSYIDSIITIYKRYPDRIREDQRAEDLVIEEKIRLIQDYRTDSQWYAVNNAGDIESQLAIIREAYEFVEPKYYNIVVRDLNEENYLTYSDLVDNYGLFPSFMDTEGENRYRQMRIRRIEISTNLAELTQNPAYYFYVIENIERFNADYPGHDKYYDYEEDKFYSSEKIYQLLVDEVRDSVFVDTAHDLSLDRDQLESFYIAASINYETMLNSPEYVSDYRERELIRITQLRAELRYFRNELDDSFEDYSTLLSYDLNDDLRTEAYARMAEISRNREEYATEEQFYREALKYASAEEKEAFNVNILAAIQSGADKFSNQMNHEQAAREYLRLAEELEDSEPEKSINFIVKAIESYKKAGLYQDAIDQYINIASRVDGKQKVFAAYLGAWSISDSLISDWNQSEDLRNRFISRYPQSNEAYRLRLQIIGFYNDENKFNNRAQAAEMYLELHDDADELDLGEDKRENIYLKALRIYQDLGNEDKSIELMLAFERMYPDHPLANEFLQRVAYIYNERGEQEKYEDLAEYIFRKDPSIDLFTAIVAAKLAEVSQQVDSLFAAGDYEQMNRKISEFEEIDDNYRQNGGDLDLTSFYDQFEYYRNYIDFYERFNAKLDYIENSFITSSPDQLIKVNELTEWKKHIIGEKRIENLMTENDQISRDVIELIREGNNYELGTEPRTHALYLTAEAYAYSGEVVKIQVRKFVDVSNQLNNEQMNANPGQQSEFKNNLLNIGSNMAFEFKKKAVDLYQSLLSTFYDDKGYADRWTEKAHAELVDLGLRQSRSIVHHYLNKDWKIGSIDGAEYIPVLSDSSFWADIRLLPDKGLLDSAAVAVFAGDQNWIVSTAVQAEIQPELLRISYMSRKPVPVMLNGSAIEIEPYLSADQDTGFQDYSRYDLMTSANLRTGENLIRFVMKASDSIPGPVYFSARIGLQYDPLELEYRRSLEKRVIYSDLSWETQLADSLGAAFDPEGTLLNAVESGFSVDLDLTGDFADSPALPIWYPLIDEAVTDYVYFYKEIQVDREVLEATAKYLAEDEISIWINDIKFVDSEKFDYGPGMDLVDPGELVVPNLTKGTNSILFAVKADPGPKALMFEITYLVQKNKLPAGETSDNSEIEISEPAER